MCNVGLQNRRLLQSRLVFMIFGAMVCGLWGGPLASSALAQTCLKPNLLFVLDKSGSMLQNNKWSDAKNGINSNTTSNASRLQYGLITFSNTNAVKVDAAIPASPAAIQSALNSITPLGDTYMVPAIKAAEAEIKRSIGVDKSNNISGRPSSIIFITDGSPSDRCPVNEVSALRSLVVNGVTYDVKTYVIGFGTNVNPICLNNLAAAGGTALSGNIKYYVASSTTFSTAVGQIANSSASEACNGLDDDCDGKVDNIKGTSTKLSRTCTKGLCSGTQTCSSGKWAACQPNPPAQAEVCNGRDDDCDGYVDNKPGTQQNSNLTRSCTTGCGTGTEQCISGAWRNCSVGAAPEVCDGKDNDCDGKVDNVRGTNTALSRSCRKGLCSGREACSNGVYGACALNPPPALETCNGRDDDCDGYIDNKPGVQRSGTLTQACKSICGSGLETCIAGAWRNCTAPKPRTETCNNKDDDCDGKIDNVRGSSAGVSRTCYVGRCRGAQICQAGLWGSCKPNVAPKAESCNNQDDDCDGYLDNKSGVKRSYTLTQACKTACGTGVETCIQGRWRNCTTAPRTESCNGRDDDCDGKIDNIQGSTNPLKRNCSVGRCRGQQICSSGQWATCKTNTTPTPEVCNGQDDDCDGYIDNAKGVRRNYSLRRACSSACGTGTEQCIAGSWRNCTAAPRSEVCDGKDNDCDGKVDNIKGTSNPLVGNCSVGRCLGKRTCTSGRWGTCKPQNSSGVETCNRKDDDCDGYIDNAKGERRSNTLKRTCKTGCGTGTEQCISGAWRNCTVGPKVEVCNGQDDDCDGKIDNKKGATTPIGRFCVTGGCDGLQPCNKGIWGVCQPNATSQQEVCNGRDDDCDGFIDNKPGDKKNYTLTRSCNTSCGKGSETCLSGRWRNCTAPPAQSELCNGKDDDCNGQIDEIWSARLGQSCTNQCGQGKYRCKANGSGVECAAPQQKPEACDGKDNDCDGKVDENWPQKGKVCVAGSGACQKTGLFLCKLDTSGVECSAKAPNQPSAEKCDGIDNDCDGKVDENLRRPCSSPCGSGDETCQEGTWSACSGGNGQGNAKPETCNNKDDDCDGYVDNAKGTKKGNTLQRDCSTNCGKGRETCIRGQWQSCTAPQPKTEICNGQDDDCDGKVDGIKRPCLTKCGRGDETCTGGKWGTCSSQQSSPEVCDGKDNNCNGQVDENLVGKCKTACGEGKEICRNGKWQFCDAPQPKPEVCDGKDNDCNGQVDDGLKPRPCKGACGQGTATCVNGKFTGCTGGPQPTPEVCDNKDNDCDGKVDGMTRRCRTVCGEGVEVCQLGQWQSCLAPHPEREKCDGVDNDCNGQVDENAPCSQGFRCLLGACRRQCRNGECPAGQRCVNGACVSNKPCDGVQCPQGTICKEDKCVDACATVKCSQGQVCKNGKCYEPSCYAYGCPLGKKCVKNVCVKDPCEGVQCGAGQFCRDGKCIDACLKGCVKGERCVDGKCEPDPCANVKCSAGERCVEGKCAKDPCDKVTCPNGQLCRNGTCEHDPCHNIQCPSFTRCLAGQCVGEPKGNPPGGEGSEQEKQTGEAGGPGQELPSIRSDASAVENLLSQEKSSGTESTSVNPDNNLAPVGCGCDNQGRFPAWLWLLGVLSALAFVRRRRRE